jgi:RNA polymerase sigma-70 factor, ECF subfamily
MLSQSPEEPPEEPLSDQALWQQVVRGDREAFHELHKRHTPSLLAYLAGRCPPSLALADVVQEVWMRLWKCRTTAFDGREVRGWLFKTAKNLLIDDRRKRRLAQMPDEFDPPAPSAQIDEPTDPRLEHLRECLKELADEFVSVIRARLEGASIAEIALRLGIAEVTVSTRANRGKKLLRECVDNKLAS